MDSTENVAGFDAEGSASLLPIYHFNAEALSWLAPRGARILDLGCGSGRFLAYLAARRPDLKLVGVDLAGDMIALGRRHLARAGLDHRVCLVRGDMRAFRSLVPTPPNVVTSIFSMHHLPMRSDLLACLIEIARAVNAEGAALWIFDHVRPHRARTADEVPEIFTPNASRAFCEDSRNSLHASWSFEEVAAAMRETGLIRAHRARSRLLPLYQIHWIESSGNACRSAVPWIDDAECAFGVRLQARLLSRLFHAAPG